MDLNLFWEPPQELEQEESQEHLEDPIELGDQLDADEQEHDADEMEEFSEESHAEGVHVQIADFEANTGDFSTRQSRSEAALAGLPYPVDKMAVSGILPSRASLIRHETLSRESALIRCFASRNEAAGISSRFAFFAITRFAIKKY